MANFFGDDGTLDKATDKIGLDFDNDRGRSNAGSNSSGGSSNSGGGTSRAPSTSPAPPKRPSGNSGSNSGGYTSLADRFDGGGPGVSGGPHKGGGIISDIGNFISSAAGGYDNVRDMGDGGGPGESDPDEFGGTLGKISNALGYKPVDGDPDTRDIGGRIGSLVGGAVAGLPGALVGRMIGSGKINLGMDSSQGPGKIDAEIEAIANDDSLSDGQKQAKANKVVAEAVEETVDEAEAEKPRRPANTTIPRRLLPRQETSPPPARNRRPFTTRPCLRAVSPTSAKPTPSKGRSATKRSSIRRRETFKARQPDATRTARLTRSASL